MSAAVELTISVDTRRFSAALQRARRATHQLRLRWDVGYRLELERLAALAVWESEGGAP